MPPPKTRLKLRAKMAAGHRLCVLRQIDDELVASLEQFLLVDDVVAVEDGAGGHMAARAELNNVRWVSHCRDLVQIPVAA